MSSTNTESYARLELRIVLKADGAQNTMKAPPLNMSPADANKFAAELVSSWNKKRLALFSQEQK